MRVGAACLAVILAPWAAAAQGNPSTEQIIEALRPSPAAPGVARVAPLEADRGRAGDRRSLDKPRPPSAYVIRPSVQLMVHFATNSTDLTPDTMAALDALGRALQSRVLAVDTFRIEGHTDTVGTREYNKLLSEMRAMRVVDYLSTRFQVDRSRLVPVGMGLEQLLVSTGAGQAEARNRRVVVVNMTGRYEGI